MAEYCDAVGVLAYAASRWLLGGASPPLQGISSQMGYDDVADPQGLSGSEAGGGSRLHPAGDEKAATLFSRLTGQASRAHRQYKCVSDRSLSQTESGSKSSSSGSSSSRSSESGTGSELDGLAAGHSAASTQGKVRQCGQHLNRKPGGASSQDKRVRKQNVLRAIRSKSGAKSWFQGKRVEGVAEGLRREPSPRKAGNSKIGCSGKTHDVKEKTERSLGTEWNVAREQSTAGNSAGHAGPAAGISRRTGTGAGDDVAGALNVVVIDRSKQVSTAGMEM